MASTILNLSDIHMRADGGRVYERDPRERLQTVLQACAREAGPVDLVVLGGDQSDDGNRAAMRGVKEIIDALGVPVVAIPGNHDGAGAHREVFGSRRVVELDGWRLIGLDSSIEGEIHGSVDVGALERALDERDLRPTLLAIHHPPAPPTSNAMFRLEHAAQLRSSLARRPHVRAVLSGHAHVPFAVQDGTVLLLGGPSTLVAFSFDGGELTVGHGTTGARVVRLGDGGSVRSFVVEA